MQITIRKAFLVINEMQIKIWIMLLKSLMLNIALFNFHKINTLVNVVGENQLIIKPWLPNKTSTMFITELTQNYTTAAKWLSMLSATLLLISH